MVQQPVLPIETLGCSRGKKLTRKKYLQLFPRDFHVKKTTHSLSLSNSRPNDRGPIGSAHGRQPVQETGPAAVDKAGRGGTRRRDSKTIYSLDRHAPGATCPMRTYRVCGASAADMIQCRAGEEGSISGSDDIFTFLAPKQTEEEEKEGPKCRTEPWFSFFDGTKIGPLIL